MKNKLLYLIFSMIASISVANADYYQPTYNQPTFNETSWCVDCNQSPACDAACEVPCDVYDAYSYMTLGVGPFVVIPNIGLGYRERYARLGWDSAVSFSTVGYVHQLSAHVVGHYYFNRCKQNSPYVGLGLMGSGVFGNHNKQNFGTLSLDFVFGKQFQRTDDTRHFIEMHVGVPTLCMKSKRSKVTYVPLMYIKYGFSF